METHRFVELCAKCCIPLDHTVERIRYIKGKHFCQYCGNILDSEADSTKRV